MAEHERPDERPAAAPQPVPDTADTARPGWYPDPWTADARRYWTGSQWTPMSFPDRTAGPEAGAALRAGHPDPFATAATPTPPAAPPAPAWVRPDPAAHAADPDPPVAPVAVSAPAPAAGGGGRWALLATTLALLLAVALIGGFVAIRGPGTPVAQHSVPPAAPSTSPPAPSPPVDPGALSDLARLGLRQSDVTGAVLVLPIDGGLQVAGETTLDLCDAAYPSEALREERVQVAGYEADGTTRLSTEAVRYRDERAVAQGWAEIEAAAQRCASTEPGTTAAPIGSGWRDVPGVRRLAYELTRTAPDGSRTRYVVVYLSRGNVLLGVYFPRPDGEQLDVAGADTVPDIVDVFAQRLAELPPSGLSAGSGGPGGVGPTA